MTLNDFLEAIAKKLIARWPVRHVFVNRIPAEADGNFYVRVIETTQEQKLDRRRVRTTRFEVCYLQADRDNLSFNTWLEAMLDNILPVVYNKHQKEGDSQCQRRRQPQTNAIT